MNTKLITQIFSTFSLVFLLATTAIADVELTSISIEFARESGVTLQWETSNETNAYYYSIERSLDCITFEEISRMPAEGPSIYEYIDADIFLNDPTTHYRLRLFNTDGSFHNLPIQSINPSENIEQNINTPEIIINSPFNDNIVVTVYGGGEDIILMNLYNVQGQLVATQIHQAKFATDAFTISNLYNLPRGIYFAHIRNKKGQVLSKQTLLKF